MWEPVAYDDSQEMDNYSAFQYAEFKVVNNNWSDTWYLVWYVKSAFSVLHIFLVLQ